MQLTIDTKFTTTFGNTCIVYGSSGRSGHEHYSGDESLGQHLQFLLVQFAYTSSNYGMWEQTIRYNSRREKGPRIWDGILGKYYSCLPI